MRLSPHFTLGELLPKGYREADVPDEILSNLRLLAAQLLEPVREHVGVPITVHSGWRPDEYNAAVGGVPTSDHPAGRAADFHVGSSAAASWEDNTFAAHAWIREHMAGEFGQLILEDHRAHFGVPGKLWIHLALRSAKHPGTAEDVNRLLVSNAPRQYAPWLEGWTA